MSSAYASPPRSAGGSPPMGSKSMLESTFQALSQAPPPSIREILGAYSAKGEADRDMLVALLNAKSAEDQRIAAVATLQQTVLQMQHSLALAQAQAQLGSSSPPPHQLPSPLLAAEHTKRARAPAQPARRSRSPASSQPYARPHPYPQPTRSHEAYSEHQPRDWTAPRRNWASMSSERSTSEEGSERE